MRSRSPDFKSEAQEAKFWDTHDIADFEDELVEDNDAVCVRPEAGFIELHGKTWDKVVETAHRERTTPGKLVHRWIRERLVRT